MNKKNNSRTIKLAAALMALGLPAMDGIDLRNEQPKKSKDPLPPKKQFTQEQEEKLNQLALDRTPHGRKAYKNYLKEIES